jgi:hypothetical protein
VPPAEIESDYGAEVSQLIEGVTERAGVSELVERVAAGPEEARLIKLCDGIDNYTGLVDNGLLRTEPVRWLDTVRRQMEPMFSRIDGIAFTKYPAAGAWLSQELKDCRERFWAVVHEVLDSIKELKKHAQDSPKC